MRLTRFVLIACALALLAGCASVGANTPTPTRTPNPNVPRLTPPDMVLVSASGEKGQMQGAYLWQLQVQGGPVADVKSAGFAILDPEPLRVKPGEEVKLEARNGPPPDTLELRIYPEEGNRGKVDPYRQQIDAFLTNTEPLSSVTLQGQPYTWTADVEPGRYFLWFKGTWTNQITPSLPMTSEFAFFVEVR